jgi:hypothetical protein
MMSPAGTKRTSSDVRRPVANGGKRTWRGQPISVDPSRKSAGCMKQNYLASLLSPYKELTNFL